MKLTIQSMPIVGLMVAEFLSLLGNQIAAVAIPILVLQFTHSPWVTGIASTASIIPIILAAVVGGRFIDRLGAWRMSVVADLLSFVSTLALPFVFTTFDRVSPALIFLLVLLGALFDPTGVAARQTLVVNVAAISERSLERVNAWRGTLENAADFIGPILGVGVISLTGIVPAFLVNAVTFLGCAAIFAIAVPHIRTTSQKHPEVSPWPGIAFIFGHPQLKSLAIVGIVTNAALLPFLSLLLPVLATQKLNNIPLLGIALSVFGLTATLSAMAFSWLSRRCSYSVIYYGGWLLTGSSILLCAFATHPYQVVLLTALAGLLLGVGNPLEQTVLQIETPAAIAGQVFTAMSAIHFAAGPVGLLLMGMLTELLSIETALLLTGSLLVTVALLSWYRSPLS
ncbi:MFS transporter [Leptolyngbya sp. FACHB-8]|uniref:MFS transporter n=1 Tax=unclassified Leptolyngbya TaxID=2650499 RepID=UPI00168229E3|nr:MFS transporter [Leptolyngbya sp. FACHB-8]MBD1913636.1 MFS transporter [Leptolyngbya sp. FACHB-8]